MKLTEWAAKMTFGFLLLISILVLAVIVARQSAEQQTVSNTDLEQILTLFSVLAGGFANWAFTGGSKSGNGDKNGGGGKLP